MFPPLRQYGASLGKFSSLGDAVDSRTFSTLLSPGCPHTVPPVFRLLEPTELRQNFLQHFPLLSRPQYHLTPSPWVLSYLVFIASYRACVNALDASICMAAPISCMLHDQVGGQSRPGGGVSIFFGFDLDFEGFPS